MAIALPFRLILASGSPARRELLTRHSYKFEVRPAAIEEPLNAGHGDPRNGLDPGLSYPGWSNGIVNKTEEARLRVDRLRPVERRGGVG